MAAVVEMMFGQVGTRGAGNLVVGPAGAFGLPPKKSGSVLRSKVCTHPHVLLFIAFMVKYFRLARSHEVCVTPLHACTQSLGGAPLYGCMHSSV
jgi:hypothetical protein